MKRRDVASTRDCASGFSLPRVGTLVDADEPRAARVLR
jgi:hypothetical protein